MSTKRDYYEVLGAKKSNNSGELKKAYHKLAMEYHPDRNPNDKEAERKFKEINEAYDVLKDEQKRAAYDRFGHNAFQNGGGSGFGSQGGFNSNDINDIFGDFFSDFMGGGGRNGTKRSTEIRGSDLKYNISINLEEAFKGIEKNITFNTEVKCVTCDGSGAEDKSEKIICDACKGNGATRIQQGFFTIEQTCSKCQGAGQIIKKPCKTCHGQGRTAKQKNLLVNIPAGIENGTRMKLTNEGEAGIRGGATGDLYVFVNIKQHELYKVEGADLHCQLPITISKAALGGEVEIPAIEGGKIKLKIPVGTQNGDQLRLKGKGMSKIRSTIRGDMQAHIYVETPKNLNEEQKKLMRLLGKELGDDIVSDDSSLFSKMKSLWN